MAKEPQQNYTQKDLDKARQAAADYIGNPKPFERPKKFKEQIKDDVAAVKESFEKRPPVDRNHRRTSNMPGSPKNQQFAGGKRDTASQFNDSYNQAGIQPSSIEDRPNKPTAPQNAQVVNPPASQQPTQPQGLVRRGVRTASKRKRLKKRGVVKKGVAKVRATAVNVWLWSWGLWAWLWFQVPMAIISIIFMALTQILWSVFNNTNPTPPDEDGNIFYQIGNAIYDGALGIIGAVAEWFLSAFGIDINALQPANFFMLTHMIVFLIGIMTLMLCYIQYKIAFLRPLGGRGAALKMGTLLAAIIGYSIPILNLFPWFMLWTFSVWLYPK